MRERIAMYIIIVSCMASLLYGVYRIGFEYGTMHGKKVALQIPASEALEIICLSLWVGEENKKFVQRGLSNGK